MVMFPFTEYWWFYAGFMLFVAFLLALDLGVFHKTSREVTIKEASFWTLTWISLALAFNYGFYLYASSKFSDPTLAKQLGLEFLTGFLVEKALAVDNIFIFAVVFSYFAIPKVYQHRVLFWGIIGALLFRAAFIALGSVLLQYHALIVFFGVVLILTGIKMFFSNTGQKNLDDNFVVKILKKVFRIHPQLDGQRFFVRKNKLTYVTPLFLALVFIELTDIIFAVDSVPAIFAITKEPLIVFTSNIFAILGLRSMYFMLAGVLHKFTFVKYGLAAVLVFIGFKMVYLNEAFGGKFPISWSLSIIGLLIGSSILVSLVKESYRTKRSVV